jgi:hypothetical protein
MLAYALAYVSVPVCPSSAGRTHKAYVREHTLAYVSIRIRPSSVGRAHKAYVSTRQHTLAYVSIRQHTAQDAHLP